jgi:hypothetical protein
MAPLKEWADLSARSESSGIRREAALGGCAGVCLIGKHLTALKELSVVSHLIIVSSGINHRNTIHFAYRIDIFVL